MKNIALVVVVCGFICLERHAGEQMVATLPAAAWSSSVPSTITGAMPVLTKDEEEWRIRLKDKSGVGFWDASFPVTAGQAYRITAEIHHDLARPANDLGVVLSWKQYAGNAKSEDGGYIKRDYLAFRDDGPGKRRIDDVRMAPPGADGADVRCFLRWQSGSARFGNFTVTPIAKPESRNVRIVTTHILPPEETSLEGNREMVRGLLERIERETRGVDLVVLPEAIAGRHVPLPIVERAETIPDGLFCSMLAGQAKRMNAYICASLHEMDGGRIYNTAVLFDRNGGLAGKYRKVHLTMSEMEAGLLPGEEFHVFDTDFGKVGLMICWDNYFPESARILRLKGAELLLFPLAGIEPEINWRTLWPARTLENGIPFVASITNKENPAAIVERDGRFVAMTMKDVDYVTSVVDLNQRNPVYWLSVGPALGDPYDIFMAERRQTAYGPLMD